MDPSLYALVTGPMVLLLVCDIAASLFAFFWRFVR